VDDPRRFNRRLFRIHKGSRKLPEFASQEVSALFRYVAHSNVC
jgi:hypothetical protein